MAKIVIEIPDITLKECTEQAQIMSEKYVPLDSLYKFLVYFVSKGIPLDDAINNLVEEQYCKHCTSRHGSRTRVICRHCELRPDCFECDKEVVNEDSD